MTKRRHPYRRRAGIVPALLFMAVIFFAGAALAQAPSLLSLPASEEPIRISADEVTWERATNTVELTGHVVVEHPDYRIEADRAQADLDTRVIQASGNVKVTRYEPDGSESELLTSDEVRLDTNKETGWMVNSRLSVPWREAVFEFQGQRFERIDDHTYLIEQGTFTWCQCREGETPDWSISAKRMEVDTEGDAVLKGARVRLRDHPVLSLPYFQYPIGYDRKSGFLFPTIETSSSDGVQIEIPYYWVIDRSMDATFAPRWIEERGLDAGGEFRYNYGEIAHGEVHGFGIDDHKDQASRGGVRIQHRTDVGDSFTGAADVTYITDNEVLFDYNHRHLGNENSRNLESRVVLSYHLPTMNFTSEFSVFDDLMGGDVRDSPFGHDRDTAMVQRLPAVTYTLLTAPVIRPLMFDFQGAAVNYYRQDVEYGRGQMLMLNPRVALPWRFFDAVDFWAAAGYREWYVVPDEEFDPRTSLVGRSEAEVLASTQFERLYTTDANVMRHSVRPTMVFFYAEDPDDPRDPFFRNLIPNGAESIVGVNLDSRLWTRPATGKRRLPVESARIELTQYYDLEEDQFRDLRLEGRVGAPTPWRISFDHYYSHELGDWSKLNSEVGYLYHDRAEIRLGYRYDSGEVLSPYFDFEAAPEEAVTGSLMVKPVERQTYEYRAYYSIRHDRMVRQTLRWDYLARQRCWSFTLLLADRIKPDDPEADHDYSASVNVQITPPDGR